MDRGGLGQRSLESFGKWGTQDILGNGGNSKAPVLAHNDVVADLLGGGFFSYSSSVMVSSYPWLCVPHHFDMLLK